MELYLALKVKEELTGKWRRALQAEASACRSRSGRERTWPVGKHTQWRAAKGNMFVRRSRQWLQW